MRSKRLLEMLRREIVLTEKGVFTDLSTAPGG